MRFVAHGYIRTLAVACKSLILPKTHCVFRGSFGPFGAVLYRTCKLVIYCYLLRFFAQVCAIYNIVCRALAVVLFCMTLWLCCRSLNVAGFVLFFLATLFIQPGTVWFFLGFTPYHSNAHFFSPVRLRWSYDGSRPLLFARFSGPRACIILPVGLCRVKRSFSCSATLVLRSSFPSRCFQ